jgi:hypothetical protein
MGSERFYKWLGFPYVGHWLLEPPKGSETFRIQFSFLNGRRLQEVPPMLDLTVVGPGKPMDFGRTAMGIPVVSPRAADLLHRVAPNDVQLIPSRIDGRDLGFSVVNVVTRLDCVDRARSELITIGGPGGKSLDGVPSWIIDPVRAVGHMLFRLDNEHVTVVIADPLKQEIERQRMVGPGMVELDGKELRQVMPGYEPERRKVTQGESEPGTAKRRAKRGPH